MQPYLSAVLMRIPALIGVQVLDLGTGGFFAFTVLLVISWLATAGLVVREHAKLSRGSDVPRGDDGREAPGRPTADAAAAGGVV